MTLNTIHQLQNGKTDEDSCFYYVALMDDV